IATGNFVQNIPGPLLDRMEVVEFAGYTEKEKAEIAKKYLLPRQLEESGLSDKEITFTDDAIMSVVSNYTRESGVRQLERQIGDVMKESARAAFTYATNNAASLGIPRDRLGAIEAHIHVPAGSIPKDGPSAGIAIATALVSEMSDRPVRQDVAMTGEITLR